MSMMQAIRPTVQINPGRTPTDSAFRALRQAEADRLLMDDDDAIVDEYRPSIDREYDPSPWDEVEWLAHSLAASGEHAEPPREISSMGALMAFYRGRLDGEIAAERERLMGEWAHDAWLEDFLAKAPAPPIGDRDAWPEGCMS